jgi:hypothetical protein
MKSLTAKQLRAIEHLLVAKSISEAAKQAGVSRTTLHTWLSDEQFRSELNRAVGDAIDATVRRLAALSSLAVTTLERAMSDAKAGYAVRIRASDVVLGRLLALRELHDHEQRIARLEAAMQIEEAERDGN